MIPLMIAGAAASGGAAVGANATTGNTRNIKKIQSAQARGGLTPEYQNAADAGYAEARRQMTGVQQGIKEQLGKMGATSGADIAAATLGGEQATADLYERAGETFRKQQEKQNEELEGRKEARRQRTVQAIGATAQGAIGGAMAGAKHDAYTNDKNVQEKEPDLTGIEDPTDRDHVLASYQEKQAQHKAGKLTESEWQQAQDAYYSYLTGSL